MAAKFTYHLECPLPTQGKWNAFKTGSLDYCRGYLDAMRGQSPRLHLRLVRSDGHIMEEVPAHDEVALGMVAGWPTADQYERAGNAALERARAIRENPRR